MGAAAVTSAVDPGATTAVRKDVGAAAGSGSRSSQGADPGGPGDGLQQQPKAPN